MQTIETIYREFAEGDLGYLDAIECVQKLGETSLEAERIVSEWVDAITPPTET